MKAALVTGGAVGIGGGGILAYKLSNPSPSISIKDLFSKERTKMLLVKDGDNEAWLESWKSYKSTDIWKLNKGIESKVPDEFKDRCLNLLGEKVHDQKSRLYSEFLSYCSRDKTILDKLSDGGRTLASDNDDTFWHGKFDTYKKYIQHKKDTGD